MILCFSNLSFFLIIHLISNLLIISIKYIQPSYTHTSIRNIYVDIYIYIIVDHVYVLRVKMFQNISIVISAYLDEWKINSNFFEPRVHVRFYFRNQFTNINHFVVYTSLYALLSFYCPLFPLFHSTLSTLNRITYYFNKIFISRFDHYRLSLSLSHTHSLIHSSPALFLTHIHSFTLSLTDTYKQRSSALLFSISQNV